MHVTLVGSTGLLAAGSDDGAGGGHTASTASSYGSAFMLVEAWYVWMLTTVSRPMDTTPTRNTSPCRQRRLVGIFWARCSHRSVGIPTVYTTMVQYHVNGATI